MFFRKFLKIIFICCVLGTLFLLGYAFNLDNYSFNWEKLIDLKERLYSYFPEKQESISKLSQTECPEIQISSEKSTESKPLSVFLVIEGFSSKQERYELNNLAIFDTYDSVKDAG